MGIVCLLFDQGWLFNVLKLTGGESIVKAVELVLMEAEVPQRLNSGIHPLEHMLLSWRAFSPWKMWNSSSTPPAFPLPDQVYDFREKLSEIVKEQPRCW